MMIFDALYRLLLRFLPAEYTARDRLEMWDTYQERTLAREDTFGRAGGGSRSKPAELLDLLRAVLVPLSPTVFFETLFQDLRTARRSLQKSPLVTLMAVTSLALGIGATSAIFSALDVWLIRPLPLPNAERLVSVAMTNRERGFTGNSFSPQDYLYWRDASETVDLAIYRDSGFNVAAGDQAVRAGGLIGSINLLPVLGIEPVIGRGFNEDEGTTGGPRVVILAHSFWQASFSGSHSVLGETLILDGVPYTIIGVVPDGHEIPGMATEFYLPIRFSPNPSRVNFNFWGVGLLRDGVRLSTAAEELDQVAARVAESDPERTFPDARVLPYRDTVYGQEFKTGGPVLAGAVLFVLLIACANIANLLLARGLARTHEMAVRGSLGAGRRRMVRQLLTESLLIAVIGGTLALGVAALGIHLLVTFVLPTDVPGTEQIVLNSRVLAMTGAVAVFSTLLFGLIPALRASKVDFMARLSDGGHAGDMNRRSRLGALLVGGEISAAFVLLVLSGLLIKDLVIVNSMEMGLRTENALVFSLYLPPASLAEGEQPQIFFEELSDRISALPQVEGVALSSGAALQRWSTFLYTVPSLQASTDGDVRRSAESRRVSDDYLDVMNLQMVVGRWLDDSQDVAESRPVVVVSRVLTDLWWDSPDDALGQRIDMGGGSKEIVGVVEAGRARGPTADAPPMVFEPFNQRPVRNGFFVVSYPEGAPPPGPEIRALVREMNPTLATEGLETIEETFTETLTPSRVSLQIFGALGSVALLLTLVGVYGVMAHSVGRRIPEMGLRIALGADAGKVRNLVLFQSGRLALYALIIGIGISLLAGQALAFFLFGVSPSDPTILGGASLAMGAAVLVASYLPARRAARVDPAQSLKTD